MTTVDVSPAAPTIARPESLVALRPETSVAREEGRLVVRFPYGVVAVGAKDAPLAAALDTLAGGPVALSTVESAALDASTGDPVSVLARLRWLLDRLHSTLVHAVGVDGRPVLTVVALTGDVRFEPVPALPPGPVRLSRLAYLRRRDDRLVLESGLAPFRVELTAPAGAALVTTLASRPSTVEYLVAATGLDQHTTEMAVHYLAGAGMTDAADPVADKWGFHEILFHSRSRIGRHDESFGATFPFLGVRPPLPAVKPPPAGRSVPLPRPDLTELCRRDPPLVLAQEARRSVRASGTEPLDLSRLGEFLYRVGRVRAIYGPSPERRMPYQGVDRPYPTGGGAGDLEIYLTAHRCQGLARAAYYYDPVGHRLVEVCTDPELVDGLLRGAAIATGGAPAPDVLLTFTSRFGRLTWKYDAMAYAATLKHVGVLYQTCYLVATAMRLAPCGLGSGDAHLAARAFGVDWQEESSVGEFMLSSLPAPGAGTDPPGAGTDPSGAGTDPSGGRPAWQGVNDPEWTVQAATRLAG
jgi:SagB-type dehydrogenase family enzyme